jgi:hypothetical protein
MTEGIALQFLTSALYGSEQSASRPGRFIPGVRVPGTHWTGGWVGQSRSGRGGEEKNPMIAAAGNLTPDVQPAA